jgi:hypothetical protein
MNIEYVLFLTDDRFALQYNVFVVKTSKERIHSISGQIWHNIYGTAVIFHRRNQIYKCCYFENDQLHNQYDPADIYYHLNGNILSFAWYINGERPGCGYYMVALDENESKAKMTYTINGVSCIHYVRWSELGDNITQMLCRKKQLYNALRDEMVS